MNELEWLADQRPDAPEPGEETSARARTALLAHTRQERLARPRAARPRRRTGILATAAVVAAGIVVGAGVLPSGDGPAHRLGAPVAAEAAPLVRLSQRIAAEPAPSGDATLVLRSHHFPDAKDFTGADLYLDDGRYFYGMTLAELKTQAKYGDIGEGVPKREREAAVAAIGLAPAAARKAMVDATWAGGHAPTAEQPAAAPNTDPGRAAKLRKEEGVKLPPPASRLSIDNNRIWMGSMDALISGAGDPKVRAGVMKLLSTIPQVKVTRRGDALAITNTDFSDGYQESLIVDARTGVIRKMIGGDTGKPASVTVTYDIRRVDARSVIDR